MSHLNLSNFVNVLIVFDLDNTIVTRKETGVWDL